MFLLRQFAGRADSQWEVMSASHGMKQYMKTFQINLTFTRNTAGHINLRNSGKQEIILHVDDVSTLSLFSATPSARLLWWDRGRGVCLFTVSSGGVWLGRARERTATQGFMASHKSPPGKMLTLGLWSHLEMKGHGRRGYGERGGSWDSQEMLLYNVDLCGWRHSFLSSDQAKLTKNFIS